MTAARLPMRVTAMRCTLSEMVVAPVPVPNMPAMMLVTPSIPMPRLTTPPVGGLTATSSDDAW